MRFDVITLFPELFSPFARLGVLGRAMEQGLVQLSLTNPRDFTTGRPQTVDDTPYGGGAGMVMRVEPLVAAIEHVLATAGSSRRILLGPAGSPLTQSTVQRLAAEPRVTLVCGRYEGVDDRVRAFCDEELSIGDYVLSGGEVAALVVIDAVARLVPGVLGHVESAVDESFSAGLLEYPHFTRPRSFRGLKVPDVLLSGDHGKIRQWRSSEALIRTQQRRPDLLHGRPPSGAAGEPQASSRRSGEDE